MGPNISRSLLFWLVLVLPLLVDAAVGASVTERQKNRLYRWKRKCARLAKPTLRGYFSRTQTNSLMTS